MTTTTKRRTPRTPSPDDENARAGISHDRNIYENGRLASPAIAGRCATSGRRDDRRVRSLRSTIADVTGKRAALAAERAHAETALVAALDAGDDGEAIVRAQSRHDALANAIAAQDRKLAELRGELASAETAERRATGLATLADFATESATVLERIEGLRAELRVVLEPRAQQLAAYVAQQRTLRERFLALLYQIAPGSNMATADGSAAAAAVLDELERRGVDLGAIRAPAASVLVGVGGGGGVVVGRTHIDQPLALADQGPMSAAIEHAITAALGAQHHGG